MTTRKILLIRHGQTEMNSTDPALDCIRGHTDVPLTKQGRWEAEQIGKKLAKSPPDVIVSSDLSRALDTAKIVSKITKVPLAWVTDYFRPWDVGKFAGQPSKDAVPILVQYAELKPNRSVPGGESFDTFRHRFMMGIRKALGHYSGVVAIVAHHRNERFLEAWKAAKYPPDGQIVISIFDNAGKSPGECIAFDIPLTAFANETKAA